MRNKIAAWVNKRVKKSQCKDILAKRRKNRKGPTASSKDVHGLVYRIADDVTLKACLRARTGFQKCLHPFDAKERLHFYKMMLFDE